MFNYGIQWNKFSDLMSYCEVQTESLLQAILTLAIAIPFSVGIRNPSYSQWISGLASFTMVTSALSKKFLPAELLKSPEKSIMSRMMRIIWAIFIIYLVVLNFFIGALVIFSFFVKCYIYLSPAHQIISIVLISILIMPFVSIVIFHQNSSLTLARKAKLNCIMLSLYFFIGFNTILVVFSFVLQAKFPFFGNGIISIFAVITLNLIFLTFVFAAAAITVKRFGEVCNLDIIASKFVYLTPNVLFIIIIILSLLNIVFLSLGFTTIYYN